MKTEVIEKLAALITAAFGLVAALAWNSAIQETFKRYYGPNSGLAALFAYAVIITILAVFITLWIGKVSEKAKTTEFLSLLRLKRSSKLNKAKTS